MAMIPVSRKAPGRVLLMHGVSWKTYSRLLRVFEEYRGVRMTYDRGDLEIMSPLLRHDKDADFLGILPRALADELGLTLMGGGSFTMRRRKKQRGVESDRCYWIANEPRMRGKDTFQPRTDPPPDLCIEVDVTSSCLDRMSIYAALEVPEVWRLERPTLTFHVLGSDGRYTEALTSLSFPGLKPAELPPFLALRAQMDENALLRQFRTWLQQRIAAGWQ